MAHISTMLFFFKAWREIFKNNSYIHCLLQIRSYCKISGSANIYLAFGSLSIKKFLLYIVTMDGKFL